MTKSLKTSKSKCSCQWPENLRFSEFHILKIEKCNKNPKKYFYPYTGVVITPKLDREHVIDCQNDKITKNV